MTHKFRSLKSFMRRKIIVIFVKEPDELYKRITILKRIILKDSSRYSEEELNFLCETLNDLEVLRYHLKR